MWSVIAPIAVVYARFDRALIGSTAFDYKALLQTGVNDGAEPKGCRPHGGAAVARTISRRTLRLGA
jgi:hypothetical protein